ncbi:MAG: hypothetical protein ACOYMN_22950 [Roseimicrobium sp.]
MKTKTAAAFLALAAMLPTACERHKWEETKQLFEKHDSHGGAGHGEGEHGKADAHGQPAAHAEKKADAHTEAKH